MKKNKLPTSNKPIPVTVVSNSTTSNASPMKQKDSDYDRKWKAQDALRDLERAEEHKCNKELMKDVKSLAKQKIKSLSNLK